MIVFDASVLVGAAAVRSGVPRAAFDRAAATDRIAVSDPVLAEIEEVLHRPALQRFLAPAARDHVLGLLRRGGARFAPTVAVRDCRDAKDDKYLELALASGAGTIVASDADLLVLDPWRGVRVLTPRAYLDAAGR